MKTESFKSGNDALRALSEQLITLMNQKEGVFNLALSGGETAKRMFSLWANEYKSVMDWKRICFYWVDERCVPKTHEESNFGQAHKLLFEPLHIPKKQYHRIKGENYPIVEAERYANRIQKDLPETNGLPHLDAIILGVGSDAHTASIFPSSMNLLTEKRLLAESQHPQTGQKRITMTGPLILNDTPLLVPVLGKDKEKVINLLQAGFSAQSPTPATYILSKAKEATLYISTEG